VVVVSAVAQFVCVSCSRLGGREHVAGCPQVVDWNGIDELQDPFEAYERGWDAARAVTVDALAGQRAGLDHALGVAEDNFNGDAQGALMLRAVRALCEAEGLLP
jgi:hypothetical protein